MIHMSNNNYRYMVADDGTITRGKVYRLSSEWTSDSWSNYWDGSEMAAFYDEGSRGRRVMDHTDRKHSQRALDAYNLAANYGGDTDLALKRVAQRVTGHYAADFIVVGLDRGIDLYVLSWNGDPDHTWRDEIEALWNGEVYRIECEDYVGTAFGSQAWQPSDEYPEEFYGEDNVERAITGIFPLAEFPAERFVGESVGA